MEVLSSVEIVSDFFLTQSPYCSVGVIVGKKKNEEVGCCRSTAFYIGNNTIVTTAHFFDQVHPTAVTFIPAMRDKNDVYGELYGFYPITEHRLHPQYVPGQRSAIYDICSAKIGEGKKKVKGTENYPIFESVNIDSLLSPLPINQYQYQSRSTKWIVLGYGRPQNPDKRMLKMTAKEIHRDEVQRNREVHLSSYILGEMSGGPWIRQNDWVLPKATGITANEIEYTICSPVLTAHDLALIV